MDVDVPIRQVEIAWGTFHATAVDGGNVRFRTRSPNREDPEHRLMLNRLWYSADVELSMDQPRRLGRYYVDDIWHTDHDDCWYRLRRYPGGGEATSKAWTVLSEQVLPQLVAWLHTDDGQALLREGSGHRQADRVKQATTAEQILKNALGQVVQTKTLLDAGLAVDPQHEKLLAHINNDLNLLTERAPQPPPAPTSSGDRPVRVPEPPAL